MQRNSPTSLFTAEAANRTLPLVSAIVADLLPLWQQVRGTRVRIKHLIDAHGLQEDDPYSDEVRAIRENLTRDTLRMEGYIDELRQLGAEFRGSRDAHVCFPSMLDGRLVYLSWLPGDLDVSHWIELDGEPEDRQSLLAAGVAE